MSGIYCFKIIKSVCINDYHLELGILTPGVLTLEGVLLENQVLRLIKKKKSMHKSELHNQLVCFPGRALKIALCTFDIWIHAHVWAFTPHQCRFVHM